ncbi:MAG: Ca-activated chloride channel [Gammaproteobacteria bacterium]|jgi:Ca-activated chloride channel family protein|nr:Ca-activated chloride channel [Gammaproteobacteria bacterium]
MRLFKLVSRAAFSALVVGLFAWLSSALPASAHGSIEAQSGTLYLKASPEAGAYEALRVATTMQAQITGNVARVHVTQKFSNTGDEWVEGLYVFPLSADAAVDELIMRVGERTLRGEIQEKAKAQAAYDQARGEGKQASIVDQKRPNMFTTAVANIAPGSSVSIEITYLETIPYRDSRYTLRLPLAITPRYTPGAGLGTSATPERVTAAGQTVDITVELAAGFPLGSVASLHHTVQVKDDASGKRIHFDGNQIAADHDFELVWTPAVAGDVAASAFAEKVGDDTFALVVLTPPNAADEATPPREVTFIIDTSGSMQGPSIEQARAALLLGIDRLKQSDLFNIIRFASDYSTLFAAPQAVDASSRVLAGQFISALRADGGTEMRAPLERAMATPPNVGFLQQIVFITDGSVGNEAELIALINQQIGRTRLFTVGIGAAPNSYFLEQAAAAGRGSYTFIADREQVGSRMQDLFHKLERPALVDLKLVWPDNLTADVAANMPGDIYAGDPLVILARLPHSPSGYLTLSGRIRGKDWVHQVQVTRVGEQTGLSKLWARERIAAMSRQLQFGGDREMLRTSILDLALKHHLVSEFTSLVAIDDVVVRPPGSSGHVEQVPTAAPTGSYWATTGFAKTATPAGLLLDWGLLCIAFGCFLRWAKLRKVMAS